MRRLTVIVALAAMLCGCGSQESFETMMDLPQEPVQAEQMVVMLNLPEQASMQTMGTEQTGSVYFCDDYVLTVQTLPGGDLRKTVMETTGFAPEQLPMIETVQGDAKRYMCVWTSAGETGNQVGRLTLLDDGSYHYILTAMAEESVAGKLSEGEWEQVFSSFKLIAPEDVVNSGS